MSVVYNSEIWGAHAPRVLFAAPPPRSFVSVVPDKTAEFSLRIAEEPFGEAPNGAREARALPNRIQSVNDSLGI